MGCLPYYLGLAASYLIGLAIFNIRAPEKYYPKKFDYCGQSHNIWHLFVIAGIICTYYASEISWQ